ncbi:MAG: AmmeMemoRadiSam system protein A [Vulcanibacillus sp.]
MGKISSFYTMPHPPIIIPEVGRGEEVKIIKTSDACEIVAKEIEITNPDTIIIITPHGPLFSDAIAISNGGFIKGNLSKFDVANIELGFEIDSDLTNMIIDYAKKENIQTIKIDENSAKAYKINYELDHGSLIPLFFINKKFSRFKIVHITFGMLPKMQLYKFGMVINKAIYDSNINAVFIASGDLSHRLTKDGPYEYSPYGEKFDKEIVSLLSDGDVAGVFNMDYSTVEKASECGLNSYYIMLGAMDGSNIKGKLLSYEGTFGVGYAVMSFTLEKSNLSIYLNLLEEKKNKYKAKNKNQDIYVRLAYDSLIHFLINGEYLNVPDYVNEEMKMLNRGVFVSLKKEGELRGCIGTIIPVTKNIVQEIIRNAVEAGQYDPRFNPVTENELDEIDISVDILTVPERATKAELDEKKYGVIVKSGKKTGLLLPDLEGVNSVEQQLTIALQKAGISANDDYIIEKFEIVRHK